MKNIVKLSPPWALLLRIPIPSILAWASALVLPTFAPFEAEGVRPHLPCMHSSSSWDLDPYCGADRMKNIVISRRFSAYGGDHHLDPTDSPYSGGNKRDKLKGTNAQDSQFFADFRRFLLIFAFPGTDFHRKPQETADFRRKPQICAETPLSHLVCPF